MSLFVYNYNSHIHRILDALAPEVDPLDDHDDDSLETASVIITSSGRPPSAILGTRVSNYETYRHRLEPLVDLEERLIHLLSSPDEDEATHLGPSRPMWEHYANMYNSENMTPPSKFPALALSQQNGRPSPTIMIPHKKQTSTSGVSRSVSTSASYAHAHANGIGNGIGNGNAIGNGIGNGNGDGIKGREIAVHTSTNWKKAFTLGSKSKSPKSAHTGEIEGWWEDPDDPVHTLNACAPAMQDMWRDPQVKKRLHEKRLRLEESSGLCVFHISF